MIWLKRTNGANEQKLGNAAMAEQRFADAERHYKNAIEIEPGKAMHHLSLGVALFEQGRHQDAQAALSQAKQIGPGTGDADFFLAKIALAQGDADMATEHFCDAVGARPRFEEALDALISLATSSGQVEPARSTLNELLIRQPQWAKVHYGLGMLFMLDQHTDQAIEQLQRAIALDPAVPAFQLTLIDILLYLGRAGDGLQAADALLQTAPAFAVGHLQRGRAFELLGRPDECATAHRRALELDGTLVLAQYGLARALSRLGRHESAIAAFERVLVLVPGYQDARYLLAVEQLAAGRAVEATASLRIAATEQPARPKIWGDLAHGAWADLDWRDRAIIESEASTRVAKGHPAAAPFDFLLVSDSALLQQQCARSSAIAAQPPLVLRAYPAHRRLRIAYLSPDFRHHAVSFLMAGVFECHHRDGFEIIGIGWGAPDDSAICQRVRHAFDRFIDVSQTSDEEVAKLLVALEIDVAVDLAGRTHNSRPGIFAWHGAAIQVNYLGFPGTLGASYIDYVIADRFVIPAVAEPFYTEKAVLLPTCFQANDSMRAKPRADLTRDMFGLPSDAFVYCCLNSTAKLSPALFDVWMRLLLATPDSVLWLLCNSPAAQANLLQQARQRGVAPDRLVLACDVDYDQHVARQTLADLGLDTFPFNGGTSVSDSLWAGLPVVTLCGEAFASRMAGSILRALGLDELVTDTLAQYQHVATRLAHGHEERAALRRRLISKRSTGALFSSEKFCVALETAYQRMWLRSLDGAAPTTMEIELV